jgi:hypothetical protein
VTAQELRIKIENEERPNCGGEPNAQAIANYLGQFWDCIHGNNPRQLESWAKSLGYKPDNLMSDAKELIKQLREEVDKKDWKVYFKKDRGFPWG